MTLTRSTGQAECIKHRCAWWRLEVLNRGTVHEEITGECLICSLKYLENIYMAIPE